MSFFSFFHRRSAREGLITACLVGLVGVSAYGDSGEAYPTIEIQLGRTVQNFMSDNDYPGMTIAVSKDGRIVMNKAYGVSNSDLQTPMSIHHRTRIGSLSKLLNAALFLQYTEESQNPELLDEPVFGSDGLLSPGEFPQLYDDFIPGILRGTPVVATVISKIDGRVYTYYDNQKYSVGTPWDLDAYSRGALDYDLPPGKTPKDIAAMAADTSGGTVTWYRDRSMSCGSFQDLRSPTRCYFEDVALPAGQGMSMLVAAAIAGSNGRVYSWFEDGTRSVGTRWDLGAFSTNEPYQMSDGHDPYDIRAMAMSLNNRVYTFYSDNTFSRGNDLILNPLGYAHTTSLASWADYEPWLAWYGDMTPRHLLSHSAGLQRNVSLTGATVMDTGGTATDGKNGELGFTKLAEYGLRTGQLLFSPGSSYSYSNFGAALAGFVLETVTGEPFKSRLDAKILGPLGITMGRAWHPLSAQDASPHRLDDGQVEPCACDVTWRFREQSGYLTANAGDFLRVLLALDGSRTRPDILSPSSIQLMETRATSDTDFGLGWKVGDTGLSLAHTGAVRGGSSVVYRFKPGYILEGQDVGGIQVVVAANIWHEGVSLRPLAKQVAKAVAQADAIEEIPSSYDLY